MARKRTRANNAFMQELLDREETDSFAVLAQRYPGLSHDNALRYADILDGKHKVFESLRRDAAALGLTVDEFLDKLLRPTG